MPKVEINITKQEYALIDGATGEKISAEEFARKYLGVAIARNALLSGNETGTEETAGKEKQ